MRTKMAAILVLALSIGLLSREAPRVYAQPKDGPTVEAIRTPDGMELTGMFHATKVNPNIAPVVVFLYPPGPDRDMTKGDWGGLAKKLNEKGFHVLQFDWRGHGKSTTIKDKQKFWGNQYLNAPGPNFNGLITGRPPKTPIKTDLYYKDLTRPERFIPAYLNDLAAVRLYIDSKNDNKELNSSSIYIVGAGDAAALGMAWLTAEWKRPRVMPDVQLLGLGATGYEFIPQGLRGEFDEAGIDFAGAVWLTATRPPTFPVRTIQQWISNPLMAPKLRENNPMLFLYADRDNKGKAESDFYFNQVLVADPRPGSRIEKLKQTRMLEIKGAEELKGLSLLGQDEKLKTEQTILDYFEFIQKERAKVPWKARKYETPYYIDLRFFGLQP